MGQGLVLDGLGHLMAFQDHLFHVAGHQGGHTELFPDQAGKDGLGLFFSVDQDHVGLVVDQGLQPGEQLVLSGVGGEAVDGVDAGRDLHILAEHGLVPHEDDARPGPPDVVLEVMAHAARVAHAAGRDDDGRALVFVDALGFRGIQGIAQVGQLEGVVALMEHLLRVLVEELAVAAEDLGGPDGQGAVHEDGHVRGQLALALEDVQAVEDLLRAFHGKGGDDDLFALAVAVGDGVGQLLVADVLVFVVAVAVGGFHEDVIGLGRAFGIAHDEGLGAADVAREDDAGGLVVFGHFQAQGTGTEDVPRIVIGDLDARGGLEVLMVAHGVQEPGGLEGVLGGVQGLGRVLEAAAAVFFGFPLGFHLLDVGAVLQHDLQQLAGGLGAVDGLAEAFAHHEGQQARMVDVRVGHKDEVDIAGGVGTGIAVALLDGLVALMHAAVDAETLAAGLYHVTGAGNGLGSAKELDFHGVLRGDVLLAGCKRVILHYALPAPEAQGPPINL